jgi:hypothetical protein
MRPLFASIALATVALAGCHDHTVTIPPGAQVIHVVVDDTEVAIQPDVVRAGDVYLGIEATPGHSLSFVARQDSADATPGPLTEADLDRLRAGDTFHTYVESTESGVMKVTVAPGTYALVGGAPEADPATGQIPPMAVLTVAP